MSKILYRITVAALMLIAAAVLIAPLINGASASTGGAPLPAATAAKTKRPALKAQLPEVPPLYRLMVERETASVWGVFAPTARVAAQIHQESRWNAKAASRYANGLSQFTPPTAKWIASEFPEQLGEFDPWDPAQAVRAMVLYDHWLMQRVPDTSECDRWAFTLAAYNGGLGWVKRDRRRASANGADSARWFGHVEAHSARAGWAIKENREYVRKILLRWEPAYIEAGWSGAAACEAINVPG